MDTHRVAPARHIRCSARRLKFMDAESHDWHERRRQEIHAKWEEGGLDRGEYDGIMVMFDRSESEERRASRVV